MKNKWTLWRAICAAAIPALIGFGIAGCDSPTNNHYTPTVDRTALAAEITAAEALRGTTEKSADGSDIAATAYWTTPEARGDFEAELDEVLDVYEDSDATQAQVTEAAAALEAANAAFYVKRERDTRLRRQAFEQVSAGGAHTVAICEDGSLWAWGSNAYGQLGDGTQGAANNRTSPVLICDERDWVFVSAGTDHTMAICYDHSLWAWGRNQLGQLGDGTQGAANNRASPELICDERDWAYVSAGRAHTLAILKDRSLWAWGLNGTGQLGDDTTVSRLRPVPVVVGGISAWTRVSAGSDHTLAICEDGSLWAWGWNANGRLGDGTISQRRIPVRIMGEASDLAYGWACVSAGWNHTMAIREDGSLWAWGNNEAGQLGDGTQGAADNRTSPVLICTEHNWDSVSAGRFHTMAIRYNDTLWAWGSNSSGQLGDSTTTSRNSPVQISGTYTSVSAGSNSTPNAHTVAIRDDGSLWAWGLNTSGQLGDGTTTHRINPVPIGAAND